MLRRAYATGRWFLFITLVAIGAFELPLPDLCGFNFGFSDIGPGVARAQAGTTRVAVLPLKGRRAKLVRERIVETLSESIEVVPLQDVDAAVNDHGAKSFEQVATTVGANVLVDGRIRKRGSGWTASLTIRDSFGDSVTKARGRTSRVGRLARVLAKKLANKIEANAEAFEATEEEEEVEDEDLERIVVLEFEGPGSARARVGAVRALGKRPNAELVPKDDFRDAAERLEADLEQDELTAPATELQVAAVVDGTVTKKGRRWTASVRVRNGLDGAVLGEAQFRGRNPGTLGRAIERGFEKKLGEAVATAEAPEPPEPVVEDTAPKTRRRRAKKDDAEEDEDRPVAVEFAVLGKLFSRELSYNDDLFDMLRGYSLNAGPALKLELRWYPGAHFTGGVLAHAGIDVQYETAFALDSVRAADGEEFPTSSQAFSAGLRIRVPIKEHELSVLGAYGGHSFKIEPSGPAMPGAENTPEIPQVDYRFVKIGLESRIHLIAGLSLMVRGAYLYILETGGISDSIWFPNLDAGGLQGEIFAVYALPRGFDVRIGFDFRRYFFTLNPEPGDPRIAGGALDQYLGYSLGLGWGR